MKGEGDSVQRTWISNTIAKIFAAGSSLTPKGFPTFTPFPYDADVPEANPGIISDGKKTERSASTGD